MVLGYILICGMGWTTPGAIEGCIVYPRQFETLVECEESRNRFYANIPLREGHYIDDSGCIVIGTGV
jgi:hypothetical protein